MFIHFSGMRNLYHAEIVREVNTRINSLLPTAENEMGEMSVTEMLAHCSMVMEMATGRAPLTGGRWRRRLFGWMLKGWFLKASPSGWCNSGLMARTHYNFDKERERLIGLITDFTKADRNKPMKYSHDLLGRVSAEDWGLLMYKHLDHHLKQFNA